MNMLTQT